MVALVQVFVAILSLAPALEPTTQPVWREKFDAVYGLAPGQILKHVEEPFIDERLEFFASAMPDQMEAIPTGPTGIFISWDDSPHIIGARFSGNDAGTPFEDLAAKLTRLKWYELDIDREIAKHELHGDWTVRKGADAGRVLEALVAQIKKETGKHLVLSSEESNGDAIVAKGEIRVDPNVPNLRLTLPLDAVQLRQALRGMGGRESFFEALGVATGYAVIDQAKGLSSLAWGSDDAVVPNPELQRVSADDLNALLKAITEQTGLTFSIEPRKFTRWRVAIGK